MNRHLITALCLIVPLGCASEEQLPPPTSACPSAQMIGDVCAGVPSEPLCSDGACTTGSCSETFAVDDAVSLDGALANAQAGDCIALAPGSYAAVALPEGVSLFGRGADVTTVSSVTTSGDDVRVRGLTVEGGSVSVVAGTSRIDAVRILDSGSDAVDVAAGASVTVERSEIKRASRNGVSAFDAGSVTVSATVIADGQGPGIWIESTAGCGATSPVQAVVSDTILRANRIVGISVVGAEVALDHVEVRETTTGSSFDYGGGLSISRCSVVEANLLEVIDNVDFGMLIDDSSVTLTGATVDNNLRGIAIQNIGSTAPASVTIEASTVRKNRGVGIGVDGASMGVTVRDSAVVDTAIVALPVKIDEISAGVEEVGDGLAWLGLSQVTLDSVTVSNSARASVLIDGEVASGSNIIDLTLAGGDEQKGIVQQNLPSSGTQPVTSGTTPAVDATATQQFPIPLDVSIPPGI